MCRRVLKVNAGKSKVMNGDEGLDCEVHVDGIQLEHISKFKYLWCVLDKSGTNGAECTKKVVGGKRVAGAIRNLQLECARVLHETLLVPVLMYGSETML